MISSKTVYCAVYETVSVILVSLSTIPAADFQSLNSLPLSTLIPVGLEISNPAFSKTSLARTVPSFST